MQAAEFCLVIFAMSFAALRRLASQPQALAALQAIAQTAAPKTNLVNLAAFATSVRGSCFRLQLPLHPHQHDGLTCHACLPCLQAAAQRGKVMGSCVFERLPVSVLALTLVCGRVPAGCRCPAATRPAAHRPPHMQRCTHPPEPPSIQHPPPPVQCNTTQPWHTASRPPACAVQLVMPPPEDWEVEFATWQAQLWEKYCKVLPKEFTDPKLAAEESGEGGNRWVLC